MERQRDKQATAGWSNNFEMGRSYGVNTVHRLQIRLLVNPLQSESLDYPRKRSNEAGTTTMDDDQLLSVALGKSEP